jgi:serine/threonine protein kinase
MTEPRRLGRYELLEPLGEGGMGAVWLARLTGGHGFEKLCIVKTVLPAIAKDPEFVSRFLHEGRVLTQLHHANIAQVYDMGEEDQTLFLALEYVPGVDLSTLHQRVRLKDEQLPLPLSLYIAQQMAEGLGYAHRRTAPDGTPLQIVHRDVSPQNVMVSWDGEVKIIDFGIARSEARSRHTAGASLMGKLGYMAPEQARGERVDHRADQYAVGVVLWELLANAPYVPRGTVTEMVVAMANPPVRPLTPLRPDVSPSVEATVLKALSADPSRRFPTTDDFARALMDELLRLGALPSKLQVGEYVRAHCEASYAAQQELLTRVSTLRTKPTAEVATQTERATPAGELDATLVRPGGEHPLPPPVPTAQSTPVESPVTREPPMTTGELQKAAVKNGRGPLFGALIAVVAIAAIAGVAFALRGGPGGGEVTATTDIVGTANAGTANAGTANTGTANTGTANAGTANAGTANAGTANAGTANAGTANTGTANTDTANTDTANTNTANTNTANTDTANARDVGSETTGTAAGSEADAGAAVATADGPPGVGSDTPAPGQSGFDASPPPSVSGDTAQLTARVRATGTSYIISNASKVRWSSCTVTAPGKRVASLKTLGVGTSAELPLRAFRSDASADALSRAVLIRCAEGEARVLVR